MRTFLIFIVMLVPGAGLAEMYGPEYQQCNQNSTVDIVDCVDRLAQKWDKRLNSAYKALMQRSYEGQKEPLKAAQRLWIKYRDANCGFYGSREGSIRQIEAAECLRVMNKQRTCEMESANLGEGSPPAGC